MTLLEQTGLSTDAGWAEVGAHQPGAVVAPLHDGIIQQSLPAPQGFILLRGVFR